MNIEIRNLPAVNGHLLNVLAYVGTLPTLPQARHYVHAALDTSNIYRVVDGSDFVEVVSAFHPSQQLALVAE